MSCADIRDLQNELVDQLVMRPNVLGFGIRHYHPDHMLRVYATSAGRSVDRYQGVPVETVEITPPFMGPEPITIPELERRVRPAIGGVSIGPASKNLAGTLGSAVFSAATHRKGFLSNWHVLVASEDPRLGEPILQPSKKDGGRYPDDVLGYLGTYESLVKPAEGYNKVDAAIGVPDNEDDLSTLIEGIGTVSGFVEPRIGQTVLLSSRGGITEGTVIDTDGIFKVRGYPWGWSLFEDQIVVVPAIEPYGASGGLLVDGGSMQAVGLAFAASGNIALANKASNVAAALGISWS